MKIVIVDNHTNYLKKLEKLLSGHELTVVDYRSANIGNVKAYDMIILSGGHSTYIARQDSERLLSNELEIVNNVELPIIGICYGFELIAHNFGCKLVDLGDQIKGITQVHVSDQTILKTTQTFKVFENHRFVVNQLTDELIGLAQSDYGYEIIKHVSKPIFGLQFHPEQFVSKQDGDEIFRAILTYITFNEEETSTSFTA